MPTNQEILSFILKKDSDQVLSEKQMVFLATVLSMPTIKTSAKYAKLLGYKSRNSVTQYKRYIKNRLGSTIKQIHSEFYEQRQSRLPKQEPKARTRSVHLLLQRALQ